MGAAENTKALYVRVSDSTKEMLVKLTELYAKELGTKVSQAQAVEISLTESYRKRTQNDS